MAADHTAVQGSSSDRPHGSGGSSGAHSPTCLPFLNEVLECPKIPEPMRCADVMRGIRHWLFDVSIKDKLILFILNHDTLSASSTIPVTYCDFQNATQVKPIVSQYGIWPWLEREGVFHHSSIFMYFKIKLQTYCRYTAMYFSFC